MFFNRIYNGFCKIVTDISWRSWRVLTRPLRRLLLFLIFVLFLKLLLSSSLYRYIVDLYIPSLADPPKKRDMSKVPVIKSQLSFVKPVVQPATMENGVFLLVLVSSGANGESHVQKRMAIRDTWGKPIIGTKRSSRIVFMLGKTYNPPIDLKRINEAQKYGDMIIGDCPDTYRNITKKLMMAFKWATVQKYEYLLKTDDDVYINIPPLINWIVNRPSSQQPLYAGVLYRATIIRDPNHRHYVSWIDLPQKRYPWYPKGALYVLSGKIVKEMVEITSKVKQITVDDAYIGVLASYLGIQAIQLHGFIQRDFYPAFMEYFDKCTYMNIFGIADNLSPKDIYFAHQEIIWYRNSSKWMCIHVHHPVWAACVALVLAFSLLYFFKTSTSWRHFRSYWIV